MFSVDFNILLFIMTSYDSAFPPLNVPCSVFLLGHSFVHRLSLYDRERGCPNLALDPTQFRIIHHAKGGLKLSGLLEECEVVRPLHPNIVFLEIGTNDLASEADPHKLAQELKRFAMYLLRF